MMKATTSASSISARLRVAMDSADEVGAVVSDLDLHALGHGGLEVRQLLPSRAR